MVYTLISLLALMLSYLFVNLGLVLWRSGDTVEPILWVLIGAAISVITIVELINLVRFRKFHDENQTAMPIAPRLFGTGRVGRARNATLACLIVFVAIWGIRYRYIKLFKKDSIDVIVVQYRLSEYPAKWTDLDDTIHLSKLQFDQIE